MRKLLLFAWLLVPVGAGAYHYGPGQDHLRADDASDAIARAENAASRARETAARDGAGTARGLWTEAEEAWSEALSLLPADKVSEARAIRLERAKAQMFVSKLPDARRDLEGLVDDLAADPAADPKLLSGARSALASARYYTTWLMRLEGVSREEWQPEIDAARQTYKLLAEASDKAGDPKAAAAAREDLEAAIRMERMEIGDLQGLPLPSQ